MFSCFSQKIVLITFETIRINKKYTTDVTQFETERN